MENKVKKSRQRRGWRKTNAKRLHEEMKARKVQAENVEDKKNTPVASVNVPVVDISLQNKLEPSDAERERQLQIENFEDKQNTVASVNVPVVGTSLQNKESSDELVRVNFMEATDSKIYQTLELMPITPEQNCCLPVEGEIDSDMTYSHRENIAMNFPFDEIQKLQTRAAATRTQDNPNHSTHHSPADSDSEEDYYTIEPEEKLEEIKISGNRVVDFMYLLEQLQEISHTLDIVRTTCA